MNVLITICARGGSVGIPGKNIKLLGGKPLIAYSIEAARNFSNVVKADIAISTDDETIRKVAEDYGVFTDYVRPKDLASSTAGKIDAIDHVLQFHEKQLGKRYDFILDLDVTSPLRTTADLTKAFQMVTSDEHSLNIFSVSQAHKSPYFNMVEQKENGYYNLVKDAGTVFVTRQSTPLVFDMNASFYIYRKMFFDLRLRSAITEKSLVYVMPHICFDLDSPLDFEFLNFLMESKKLSIEI